MSYRVREATVDDVDVLVHHRIAMFQDMGREFDPEPMAAEFATWLRRNMATGAYRAWLVETDAGTIAAGGGATIVPWPPGPNYMGHWLAFVYNVYTERAHRRRGLARDVMEAIHAWCRANGVTSVALNASTDGQPLYAQMGYAVTSSPMMFLALTGV